MIRTLPALGEPGRIIFCLALASVLLHKRMGRELREAGAEVQLSQSERPQPRTDTPAKSVGNCTSGKERATFRGPSDMGSVQMWPLPCLCCQTQRGGGLSRQGVDCALPPRCSLPSSVALLTGSRDQRSCLPVSFPKAVGVDARCPLFGVVSGSHLLRPDLCILACLLPPKGNFPNCAKGGRFSEHLQPNRDRRTSHVLPSSSLTKPQAW